jgi:hypothetical protein
VTTGLLTHCSGDLHFVVIHVVLDYFGHRDISLTIMTRAGRPGNWGSVLGTTDFFLHYSDHTGSGSHLISYSAGTRGTSPGGKAARA